MKAYTKIKSGLVILCRIFPAFFRRFFRIGSPHMSKYDSRQPEHPRKIKSGSEPQPIIKNPSAKGSPKIPSAQSAWYTPIDVALMSSGTDSIDIPSSKGKIMPE